MPFDLLIRRIVAADIPTLQQISIQARQRYHDIPELAYVVDTPPVSRERFRIGHGWVAEAADEIVGYALTNSVDNLMFLDNISTQSAMRGVGVGTYLMDRILKHATKADVRAVALTTFRSAPWNGPWFRRFGFSPMPEVEIGTELSAIIQRQSQYLNSEQRETLWLPSIRST